MRKILKGAVVLLIAVAMVFSSVAVTANTSNEQKQLDPASPLSDGISDIVYDFPQKINIQPKILPAKSDRAILISEGFEGVWVTDPDGDPYIVPNDPNYGKWDIDGICTNSQGSYPGLTHYWSDFTPSDHPNNWPFPKSGSYCAGIWWSDGTGGETTQDEWIITPNMDTSEYTNLKLTFYSLYNMMRGYTNPNGHHYVKFSTDGGLTWVSLGDLYNDPQFDFNGCTGGPFQDPSWNWNEVQIVLNLPDSDQLMIAWHYEWDGTGTMGIWMIDDVQIIGKKTKDINEQRSSEITPFWDPEHTVSIHIDKIYVKESGDRNANDPGEYFFKLISIPELWHWTTDIYEVDDETPEVPYDLGKLGAFKTKFTPQWIIILAIEEDKDEGIANFNDFLGWKIIKFKPPQGDYPKDNPYIEIVQWENQYFKAVTKIYFSYD